MLLLYASQIMASFNYLKYVLWSEVSVPLQHSTC